MYLFITTSRAQINAERERERERPLAILKILLPPSVPRYFSSLCALSAPFDLYLFPAVVTIYYSYILFLYRASSLRSLLRSLYLPMYLLLHTGVEWLNSMNS